MLVLFINYSSIPPEGYAGDPPNNRYCTSCHTGSLNSGPGWVTVRGLPATYDPATTYTLTLVVYDTTAARFGCEMVAKDTTGNVVGSFTPVGPNTTVTSGGYAVHENAPYAVDSFAFVFEYTTPDASTYSGPIVIYAVGNAADGNGSTLGDNVYSFVDTLLSTTDVSEVVRAGGVMLNGRILTVEARGEVVDVKLYGKDGRMKRVFTGIVFGRRSIHLKDGGVLVVKMGKRVRVFKVL